MYYNSENTYQCPNCKRVLSSSFMAVKVEKGIAYIKCPYDGGVALRKEISIPSVPLTPSFVPLKGITVTPESVPPESIALNSVIAFKVATKPKNATDTSWTMKTETVSVVDGSPSSSVIQKTKDSEITISGYGTGYVEFVAEGTGEGEKPVTKRITIKSLKPEPEPEPEVTEPETEPDVTEPKTEVVKPETDK